MLINRLLKLLGEEAEIDDELYDKIHDNMIERLKDKVAEIRAQAVHALQRLQDPRDNECPIIKVTLLRPLISVQYDYDYFKISSNFTKIRLNAFVN